MPYTHPVRLVAVVKTGAFQVTATKQTCLPCVPSRFVEFVVGGVRVISLDHQPTWVCCDVNSEWQVPVNTAKFDPQPTLDDFTAVRDWFAGHGWSIVDKDTMEISEERS